MIQMPDVKLKIIIDAILGKIKSDYELAVDKTETFLYKMYGTNKQGNYNFIDNAVKIFNRNIDDPRTIDTRLLFDRERASLPTVHVTVPSETPFLNSLGFDEGSIPNTLNGDGITVTEYYSRGYKAKFELIITGSNSFEVALIFYTLKAALINNIDSLEYNGFRDPKIYGSDLKINDSLQPIAYMRVINVESFFELIVPKFDSINITNNISFNGEAYY